MTTEQSENKQKENNEDAGVKPDSETLKTTDPQEHMEGPVSSLVQKAGEGLESEESGKEAEKETEK